MPLSTGARVGVFEIITKLGEGGMGEVYRAHDTTLDRDVALKVLPEVFTSDPERLARFEREARVLASLNHPNIAQVYGFDSKAIAMELVDGETLDEIIRGAAPRGLPLDRSLVILRQIAAALEAAHEQGIVHRDLKPANIKVRDDGTVKVLDFGLAKAFSADAESAASGVANSPTLTARSTQLGMILGTAAYMSPEQAKGRSVDRRADVWAFGAVFFEMLSGQRAFDGDDVSEVLAAVLKTEPDWSLLPADLPAPVQRLLRRCLEKDPKKRLRDASEGLLQMDESLAGGAAGMTMDQRRAADERAPAPLLRRALPVAVAVLVTALAVFGITRAMAPPPAASEMVRFTFDPAPVRVSVTNARQDLAISPDGRSFAFTGTETPTGSTSLYLRRLDQLDTIKVRGGEVAHNPFFSPDSQWIGFVNPDDVSVVKKVPAAGGPAIQLGRLPGEIFGAAWLDDGNIVLGTRGPLYVMSDGGGTPEALTELDQTAQENGHMWPSPVPGTSLVLFTIGSGSNMPMATGRLAVVDRRSKRTVRLGVSGSAPRFVPPGYIVYAVRDGSIRAIKFNPAAISVSGTETPVLEGVAVKPSGAADFAVANDGRLVYLPGDSGDAAQRVIVWADRTGRETPIGAQARTYFYARIAPDSTRLSLDVRDEEEDIWIWDIARGTMSRLTDKVGADQYGLWTRDAQRVVFSTFMTGRNELFAHRPDGVGQPQQITDAAAEKLSPFPNAITSDGKQVIFRSAVGGKNDLFVVDIGGDRKSRTLLATEHDELNAALSPDDKFMVFQSDLSGRYEVYVRPFPDVDRRQWPVSTAGGTEPVWSPTGREIFYIAGTTLMAVPVSTANDVVLLKPTPLFDVSAYFFGGVGRNYDVDKDGKRFVMVKNSTRGDAVVRPPIDVVLNWADEVRARVR